MKERLISVVTTFFNAEKTIKDTIDSISSQDYQNIEVIFVDGKSTDSSLEIVKENAHRFKNIKIISEPDDGIYDGMNKGISSATGEIIAILNADDYFEPTALSTVNDLFETEGDMVAATIQKIRPDGSKEAVMPRSKIPPLSPSSAAIHHPAVFVKKRLYEKVGSFDIKYKISADYDFIARAINAGAKVIYSDFITTNMRVGGVSDSIKFHTRKNKEHLMIGFHNISSFPDRIKHIYYVVKKYVYGLLKFKGFIK